MLGAWIEHCVRNRQNYDIEQDVGLFEIYHGDSLIFDNYIKFASVNFWQILMKNLKFQPGWTF